jgi:transposase
MPKAPLHPVATLGIDIGKNSFHLIGLDARGAIVLRRKLSCGQVEQRLATMPTGLIGMEACVGANHLSRQLLALGHDVKLMPAQFVKPFRKSHKNDFRDAEAIAEAVQRPTMQAARVLLLWPAKGRQHSFGNWLTAASMRLHHNVLAAALANKLARIAWSVLSQNRTYEPRAAAVAGRG